MPSMGEYLDRNGPVLLGTFGNQVGGHFLLMKFVGDTICKPLVPREHFFYESIPPEIRTFTATYYGVISVGYHCSATGELQMFAHPKRGAMDYSVDPKYMPDGTKVKCSIGECLHKGNNGITFKAAEGYSNPWSEQGRRMLQSLGDKMEGWKQDYVVLENLTAKYDHPCILDLKVGTRQHGDDAPEEKVRRHTVTCATSTSLELGIRVCGMQKYNAATDEYLFRDKYYGRQLDKEGFFGTLSEFLHNGTELRSDLLPDLVGMLKQLRETISRQNSYRLYSSSLLIIYDGKVGNASPRTADATFGTSDRVDTREVRDSRASVAHTIPFSPWHENTGTDHPNHDSELSERLKPPEIPPHGGESRKQSEGHRNSKPEERGLLETEGGLPSPLGRDPWNARHAVDVRMIDFAHATHEGYTDDVIKYSGPDEGYIKGLTTLINAFEGMRFAE